MSQRLNDAFVVESAWPCSIFLWSWPLSDQLERTSYQERQTYKALCQKACWACGAQASMEGKWEVTFHRAGGSSLEFPITLRISCELVMIMEVNHQARQWRILSQSWAHMLFNWRMGGPPTECSTNLPSIRSNEKLSQRKNLTGCYFHRQSKEEFCDYNPSPLTAGSLGAHKHV